jgi:hypothetical protein
MTRCQRKLNFETLNFKYMENDNLKNEKQCAIHDAIGSSLTWIEKDQIASNCLNEFLKDEPNTSPLYDISSKLLRQLIIEGIDAGLNYR